MAERMCGINHNRWPPHSTLHLTKSVLEYGTEYSEYPVFVIRVFGGSAVVEGYFGNAGNHRHRKNWVILILYSTTGSNSRVMSYLAHIHLPVTSRVALLLVVFVPRLSHF